MAIKMRIDDEIRIKLLDALHRPRSVVPSVRQIQNYTEMHKATIKSSIDFLEKQGVLYGYGPKMNFRQMGFKLEVLSLLELDMNEREKFDQFIEIASKDPNLYLCQGTIGAGNFNVVTRSIYSDVESFHRGMHDKYYSKIKGSYSLIKNQQHFYLTEPIYKYKSRTDSVIEIMKKERGF
ncbi:MAG: hypothetical protein WC602_02110 [archaeon]